MAQVALVGRRLPGARKYLGGSPDASEEALVGIPSHASAVLRVQLPSGHITLLPKLPLPSSRTRRGRFKWLRAVLAPDGSIFGIPACADCVLRISRDGSCETLGRDLISSLPPGDKWYGGIKADDGSIWGIPYNAPRALKIVPETGEVSEVGHFGWQGWKWHGGLRSGRYIIGIPSHSDFVLRIEPACDEVRLLHTGIVGGKYKWAGGVADQQGNVWTVPGDSRYVLKKLSLHGELGETSNKFQGAYQAVDGTIWALPENCAHVMRILPPAEDDSSSPTLPSWRATQPLCLAARQVQRRWRVRARIRRAGTAVTAATPWSALPLDALRLMSLQTRAHRGVLSLVCRGLFHLLLSDETPSEPLPLLPSAHLPIWRARRKRVARMWGEHLNACCISAEAAGGERRERRHHSSDGAISLPYQPSERQHPPPPHSCEQRGAHPRREIDPGGRLMGTLGGEEQRCAAEDSQRLGLLPAPRSSSRPSDGRHSLVAGVDLLLFSPELSEHAAAARTSGCRLLLDCANSVSEQGAVLRAQRPSLHNESENFRLPSLAGTQLLLTNTPPARLAEMISALAPSHSSLHLLRSPHNRKLALLVLCGRAVPSRCGEGEGRGLQISADRLDRCLLASAAQRAREDRQADQAASTPHPSIAGWQAHFQKHSGAFERSGNGFFKERRFLLAEFPMLCSPLGRAGPLRVLEVGAGNGSSVLPLLRGNPSCLVHASDPSEAAVDQTVRTVSEWGLSTRLSAEVQAGEHIPCSPSHPPFDLAMLIFTLSAVPGDGDVALLRHTAEAVGEGGAVLVRDYGQFDQRHLRDASESELLVGGSTPFEYLRPGGMYRRYYSLERIAEIARTAGLELEELRYLCVRLTNTKKQLIRDSQRVQTVAKMHHGETNALLDMDDCDAEDLAGQLLFASGEPLMRNLKQHVGTERLSLARLQREGAAQFGGDVLAHNIYDAYGFHLDGLFQLVVDLDLPVTVCVRHD
ncbi:MAG: hypothetical protein SGPRY_002017 [Prymnesium sp.]